MQNIRKIFSLDSENNAYKVVDQSFFKAFLIVTFDYLWRFTLSKNSEKSLRWILRTVRLKFRTYGVKWRNFGVSKSFYEVFSISLLFTLSFKISENL